MWRHNGRDSVSNHEPHDSLLNRLFRRRSKKTSKLRVTGLCAPGTGEYPAQMASDAENVYIWWRHHISTFSYGLLPICVTAEMYLLYMFGLIVKDPDDTRQYSGLLVESFVKLIFFIILLLKKTKTVAQIQQCFSFISHNKPYLN